MTGNKRLAAIVIALMAIVSLYYLLFSHTVEAPAPETSDVSVEETPIEQNIPHSISVLHTYKKGKHTVRGTLDLPTPCHTLEVVASVASSTPGNATLTFTTTDPGGLCIQVIDSHAFSVSFTGVENITLKGVLDGVPVTLVVAEA